MDKTFQVPGSMSQVAPPPTSNRREQMSDFIFRGTLADLDPAVHELAQLEAERQARRLILIPSESLTPLAVREALGSAFHNIYAEGYPDEETRWMREDEILDYPQRLAFDRRYSDPRYYKGVEYANIVEALARRRAAELFATDGITADDIYVNVQALSGAPANNAVYTALINPGDTLMGMDLFHGGHLTHGSPVNRSGKLYNPVHYTVDPQSERIDYAAVEALALETKPKIIVVGYSSYPWSVDWNRFRAIADAVGAYLMADISHVSGLVVTGEFPSPMGIADVITFTTHKTMCGPRGACILTTNPAISRKIDKAVFPGEQGGPHVNVFAALATTFKLAKTEQFCQLQRQIRMNAAALADRLVERGFRLAFGGTDTHMLNLDVKSVQGQDGTELSGDQAARILALAGLVANRNTIPGDTSALRPSGVRMASPWVTQRGFKEAEMIEVADIIADLLNATIPYNQPGRKGELSRSKVDFTFLEDARLRVRALTEKAGIDHPVSQHGYPHFYFLDTDTSNGADWDALDLTGEHVREFLHFVLTSDVDALPTGGTQATRLITPQGAVDGYLSSLSLHEFRLTLPAAKTALAAAWMRDLSDGYVYFDPDLVRKIPGPTLVLDSTGRLEKAVEGEPVSSRKPYYIGIEKSDANPGTSLPDFSWTDSESSELRRTPIYDLHVELGGKMVPFAGWEMPVRYSSVMEEHMAVRQNAGLFDVAHMGVYQVEGPDACAFLDGVCGNDIASLAIGESLYTHFLDPDANVIDDLLVYHRGQEKYLVVVNASNDDKDWAWLNAVKDGTVCVDRARPWARSYGYKAILRNLRDPQAGEDMRVDIALQGPRSRDILLAMGCDGQTRKRILKLKRTELCEAEVGGFDLVVSRTGYTGERMAFELFVHPQRSADLFRALLAAGEPFGLKPCGLGARDSLRTEAGLPLYGHEMGGDLNLGVGEAGFGSYVKVYKPWFIGRQAFQVGEASRGAEVIRFRFSEKGVRMAHPGDPVVDKRGRVIGTVTSCAADRDGYLTGQADVDLKSGEIGSSIYIFQGAADKPEKAPADLKPGDRTVIPTQAVILNRFM
jgi:glycine hydroxymethyltransferase